MLTSRGVEADVQEPAVKKSKLDPQIVVRKAVLEGKDTMNIIGSFLKLKDRERLGNTSKSAKDILLDKEKMQKLKASLTCDKCQRLDMKPSHWPLKFVPKRINAKVDAGRYCRYCRPLKCCDCQEVSHRCELLIKLDGYNSRLVCEDCFHASGADLVCASCGYPHDEDELDADGMCEMCGGSDSSDE